MKIISAKIVNFRSIKEIEISFDKKYRILVGKNESGKSNILKALSLLNPEVKTSPEDIRETSFSENEEVNQSSYVSYIDFVFQLNQDEKDQNYLNVAEVKIFLPKPSEPVFILDGKTLELMEIFSRASVGYHRVSLYPKSQRAEEAIFDYSQFKITPGFKKLGSNSGITKIELKNGTMISNANSCIIHQSLIQEEQLSGFIDATVFDVFWIISQTVKQTIKASLPECIYWQYSEANLLPGKVNRDEFIADPDICLPLQYLFNLAGYDDISTQIKESLTLPNRYDNLLAKVSFKATEHLQSVWEEYKDVKIEINSDGDTIKPVIRDESLKFDLNRRSDGFKRFMTFLIYISARVKSKNLTNSLYLHDEPDISLHPSGARFLRDELINISRDNYVVYSTHSIYMIDKEKIENHIIVEKINEITTATEANDANLVDEEVLYRALGASIFDGLKKENFIFEGWRDKKLFTIFLGKEAEEKSNIVKFLKKYGICHVKGIKNIENIVPILDLANRNWVVISDSDEVGKQKKKELLADEKFEGKWFIYNDLMEDERILTSEDFVKAKNFVDAMRILSRDDASISEITTDEFSDAESKLKTLERLLTKQGISKDNQKKVINQVKSIVFENLDADSIEASYKSIISNLIQKLQM